MRRGALPRPRRAAIGHVPQAFLFVGAFGAAVALSIPSRAAPTPRECAIASEEALSLRKQEKLLGARERLLVCSDASCPAEVREECARRMPEIASALPSVVFDVKDAAGNDLAAVRVSMDGTLLVDRIGAAAIAIDPGEHTFRFETATAPPLEKKLVVREGEKNLHLAIALATSPAPPAIAAPPPAPSPREAEPKERPTSEASSWSGQKTWALVLGGAGVVGVGLGSVFGLTSFSKWSEAQSTCGDGCGPNDPAQSTKSDAQSAATISTAAFVVGGLALGGAALLWFTAPSGGHVQIAPTAGAQSAGVSMRGTFQ